MKSLDRLDGKIDTFSKTNFLSFFFYKNSFVNGFFIHILSFLFLKILLVFFFYLFYNFYIIKIL